MVLRIFTSFLALSFFVILSGCSFKSAVHPYPYQYTGNPEEAADQMYILRQDGYLFLDADSSEKTSLNYKNGALAISNGVDSDKEWLKEDTFSNPVNNQIFSIKSVAKYTPEYEADEFIVELYEGESDSVLALAGGYVDDAFITFSQNEYRFTQLNVWDEETIQENRNRKVIVNYYPFGASWSLSINGTMIGEIIQGSPVVDHYGSQTHYGQSFTFLFFKKTKKVVKAELINAWMAYLALTDIEYYYYECDYNYEYDLDCPESIDVN